MLEGLGTCGLPHLTLDMPLSGDGVGGVGHSWPPTPHMHSLHSMHAAHLLPSVLCSVAGAVAVWMWLLVGQWWWKCVLLSNHSLWVFTWACGCFEGPPLLLFFLLAKMVLLLQISFVITFADFQSSSSVK